FFIERFAKKFGKQIDGVSHAAMEALVEYRWPGNIRELQNVIERSVVVSQHPVLALSPTLLPVGPADGRASVPPNLAGTVGAQPVPQTSSAASSLENVEREHILAVLKQTRGVVEGSRGAAQILNLHPNTLRSRMKKLGIPTNRIHHEIS